jgi:hypothetical protein
MPFERAHKKYIPEYWKYRSIEPSEVWFCILKGSETSQTLPGVVNLIFHFKSFLNGELAMAFKYDMLHVSTLMSFRRANEK